MSRCLLLQAIARTIRLLYITWQPGYPPDIYINLREVLSYLIMLSKAQPMPLTIGRYITYAYISGTVSRQVGREARRHSAAIRHSGTLTLGSYLRAGLPKFPRLYWKVSGSSIQLASQPQSQTTTKPTSQQNQGSILIKNKNKKFPSLRSRWCIWVT